MLSGVSVRSAALDSPPPTQAGSGSGGVCVCLCVCKGNVRASRKHDQESRLPGLDLIVKHMNRDQRKSWTDLEDSGQVIGRQGEELQEEVVQNVFQMF